MKMSNAMRSWARTLSVSGLLSLAMVATPLLAQDDAIKGDVVKGLAKLALQEVAMSGTIEEEEVEAVEGTIGMQLQVSMLGGSRPFFGEVDLLTRQGNEVVLVSKSELPGVKVYAKGEEKLCVQAMVDEPLKTTMLAPEIAKLCSWHEVAEAVRSASKVRATSKGKQTEVRVVLDSSYFPVESNEKVLNGGQVRIMVAGPGMSARVMELSAIFTLNEAKDITGVQYTVQYNDPMKAMFKGAAGGIAMVRAAPAAAVPALRLQPAQPIAQEDKEKEKAPAAKDADTGSGVAQQAAPIQANAGRTVVVQGNAAAMKNAIPGAVQGAVRGMPLVVGGGDDGEESLGKTVIYDFQVTGSPAPRVTAFVDEAKRLLKNRQQ